ncbi:MAG: DMT family transporter [Dehalococcoidia bacterium]
MGDILPVVTALGAAASWGFSAVLVRKGLRDLSTSTGTLLSLCSGLVFTALLVLVLEPDGLRGVGLGAVAIFGVIGILNFPVGRFFNYMAMGRLGVSRSTPILASAPLFAVVIAMIFLGEQLTAATVAGIALILSGLYVTVTAPR